MIFNNERHLTTVEYSNTPYEYDSSITNFHPDFKLTSLSYVTVISPLNIVRATLRPII
jgi:hypothetical protein